MADFTLGDPRERLTTSTPVRGGLRAEVARPAGSGVGNSNFRAAGPGDEIMPAFLAKAVEPYIKRKQEEAFRRGAIEQFQAGAEVDVLDDEGNLVSNIFGPNHAEQGAAAMRTSLLVQNQEREWTTNRLPDLIAMPPQEAARALAADAEKLKTGNRWTDELLEGEMLKSLQRTVQIVTQKRTEHIQTQAYKGVVDMIVSKGQAHDAYQKTRLEAGGEAGAQAPDLASEEDFMGVFRQKVPGMLDERWADGINDGFTSLIEKHSFRPYLLARQRGLIDLLPQEKKDKLNERYETESRQALTLGSEAFTGDLAHLHWRMKRAESPDWKPIEGDMDKIDPMTAMKTLRGINAELRRVVGTDVDFFSSDAILKQGTSIIDAVAAADKEAYNRAFATSERKATEAARAAEKQAEAARSVAAFNTGTAGDAIMSGSADRNVVEMAAAGAAQSGNFAPLVTNFTNRKDVFSKAADTLQAPIESSLGLGYTNEVDKARTQWETLNGLNTGAAMAYYGKHYDGIRRVSQLVNGQKLPPQVAWMRVYGESLIGPNIEIKPERRKEALEGIEKWIDKNGPENFLTAFGMGPRAYNASARRAMTNAAKDQVAIMQDSTMSTEQIIGGSVAARQADGSLEVVGPFAWEQRSGTIPLHKRVGPTGVPKDTFDGAFYREVDTQLRKVSGGKVNGSTQEFDFMRQENSDGTTTVLVFAGDGTGKTWNTSFTTRDIYARITAESNETTRKAQAKRDWLHGRANPGGPTTFAESLAAVGEADRARNAKKDAAREASLKRQRELGFDGIAKEILGGAKFVGPSPN